VLQFMCILKFTTSSRQTWSELFVVLLGGGLGGHIKLGSTAASAAGLPWIQGVINDALQHWLLWEEYRGHYVFNTLFDTHFLVVWLFTTGSVLALYHSIRNFSIPRLALASALCGLTTLVHVYEGVTLVAIAASIAIVCWHKQIAVRPAFLSAAACTVSVMIAMTELSLL
jgi:hypothetical protein